jgi:pilus assembly protein CpaB
MDRSRIIVLAVAAIAAGAVAMLARTLLGGGTPPTVAAPAPRIVMSDVLVAATNLTPGAKLKPESVRWQDWPKTSVDPTFITRDTAPDISQFEKGTVVRAPMMAGEPLTVTKIVHADSAGFLAAQLMPGMRAVSISISVDTGAGGFILPNDRVDVVLTQHTTDDRHSRTQTILKDIRVLAVDQTYETKDSKTVVGRTATIELDPQQVELIERDASAGSLALALRPLGETDTQEAATSNKQQDSGNAEFSIIRYGVQRQSVVGTKE